MTSRFNRCHPAPASALGARHACLADLALNPSHCPNAKIIGTNLGTPRWHWIRPIVPLKLGFAHMRRRAHICERAWARAGARTRACTRTRAANPDVWDIGTDPILARCLAVPMIRLSEFNGTDL